MLLLHLFEVLVAQCVCFYYWTQLTFFVLSLLQGKQSHVYTILNFCSVFNKVSLSYSEVFYS